MKKIWLFFLIVSFVCSLSLAKPVAAKLDLYLDFENVSADFVKFVNEFGPLFSDFYKKNEKLIKGDRKVSIYEAVKKGEKTLIPCIVIYLDNNEESPAWYIENHTLKNPRAIKRAALDAIRRISYKLKK